MSVFQRVAAIATMTLCAAGLVATSAPVLAYETPAPPAAIRIVPAAAPVIGVETPHTDTGSTDTINPGDTVAYPTLDAAVAAQDATAAGTSDLMCLAGAIYFESKGEPLAGQLAVAHVIMNRANSGGRFPTGICNVVTQRGQFSFVKGGRVPAIDAGRAAYRTALAVAKVALAKAWNSPAPKALFFNTPGNPPAARLIRVASIGNHVFYR